MILPSTAHNGILIIIIGAIISIPFFIWAYILYRRQHLQVSIGQLKSRHIAGYSSLDIFDALRDSFALGLTYPQIHAVLVPKLPRVVAWGVHSSDIIDIFTRLGLIQKTPPNSTHLVWIDFEYKSPNYVYQLTDKGKLLAQKLMSQKPKIKKGEFNDTTHFWDGQG